MKNDQFKTPILFMVFNRPDCTKIVFEEIRKLKPQKLFISADGPRPNRPDDIENCKKTREIVENVDWPCEIHKLFRDKNLGCHLAPSSAVTWFFENIESGIILEDDCIPEPSFFKFCEELLEKYKDNENVMQISGSSFQQKNKKFKIKESYYFSVLPYLWGWASWRRAWNKYDIEMKKWPESKKQESLRKVLKNNRVYKYWVNLFDTYYNGLRNSWDRPWAYVCMDNQGLSITPKVNMISNIGFGTEATHTKNPESELSKMKVIETTFPLIHPNKIEANKNADDFAFKTIFGGYKSLKDTILEPIKNRFPKQTNKIKKFLKIDNYKNFIKKVLIKGNRNSFSQCGEDIIMDCALSLLNIKKPNYLEIGTNNPISKNNTYLFYLKGSRGVCIEPDPELFENIKKIRKGDICLNIGIGPAKNSSAEYYVMTSKALNTFLKEEAQKYVNDGNFGKQKIEKVIKIPLENTNDIIQKYFSKGLDIMSLDTEGYDFEILKSINFDKYRPKIICVESARYEGKKMIKENDIIDYMLSKDYFVYGDTFINTIFIDKKIWPL